MRKEGEKTHFYKEILRNQQSMVTGEIKEL